MSSNKGPSSDAAATLASATAKTRSVIEGLQARLNGEAQSKAQVTSVPPARKKKNSQEEETEEELERQLQTYFATAVVPGRSAAGGVYSRAQMHDELRSRVVEEVVHRILADWARREQELPGSARLGNEIMERLIQRVLEQFRDLAVA